MTRRTDGPSAQVRIRVMKRDRFQCTYCGAPGTEAELEVDHIIAVARGGSHHMSNLTTACRACNQAKRDGDAPKRYAPPPGRAGSPLVGLWLWTLSPDASRTRYTAGVIPPGWAWKYQGCVIGVHEQTALVQLYSHLDGTPTQVIGMHTAELFSERCLLFRDNETMLHFAERYSREEDRRERRLEVVK